MSSGHVPEREFTQFLAGHLELIEPGMTLVDTEVTLRDPDGASGRVDIVAHDRYGNVAVIEVKCSDHSAREAAHEIFKYSEILRSQQQIDESEFRCILVSTHWRELHRAFTDYAARHHDVVGYRAEPADGAWSITRVEPLPRCGSVVLNSAHAVFLYSDPAKRHDDFTLISAALAKMGAPHQIGILMQNDVHEVMFPYALYVILGTAGRSPAGEDYPRDPVENDILDNVLPGHHADDLEEGSPEKLGHVLSTVGGWHATEVLKAGAFARRDRLGVDDLLIRAAVEMPGFTNTAFVRRSSPSRSAHWAVTRELALGSMPTSQECREVVARWLDEVEQTYAEHTIVVRIRNPGIIRPLAERGPEDLDESPMSLASQCSTRSLATWSPGSWLPCTGTEPRLLAICWR
ncbi:endonuclease NucS domain-containing protein [Actinoplanes sp. NBRC 103695]|uniref:endonuclease NucS domain-containing protein n=1 Tax=Actinoplanes sp. NBRC 103695 TaxID=3032202 RepID=UPI00255378DA|nr:endonuclease NucS domain-containing protein [Actinoplanes sp. NBRC 103695]